MDQPSLREGTRLIDEYDNWSPPSEIVSHDRWYHDIHIEGPEAEANYTLRFGTEISSRAGRPQRWVQVVHFRIGAPPADDGVR